MQEGIQVLLFGGGIMIFLLGRIMLKNYLAGKELKKIDALKGSKE